MCDSNYNEFKFELNKIPNRGVDTGTYNGPVSIFNIIINER